MREKRLKPLRRTKAESPLSVKGIRNEYLHLKTMKDEELLDAYREWRQLPIWLLFQEQTTRKIIAVRGTKRGDKQHARKADTTFNRAFRIKPLTKQQQRTKNSQARTNCLWIGLTYDGETGAEAYSHIGKDINRFLSAIKKAYGKIMVIRVWESQKRGTPHAHLLIIFLKKSWSWIWRKRRNNPRKEDPRIFGHREIKKYWKPGWSDIKAVTDYEGAVRYLKKYLTKQLESREDKDDLACAHQMIYNNHSYHVPSDKNINRALEEKIPDLIYPISNSNSPSEKESSKWQFLGTFNSYEPLHRTEIYEIETKEHRESYPYGKYTIISVVFLYDWEIPLEEIIEEQTEQTLLIPKDL